MALALPEEVRAWFGGPDRARTRVTTLYRERVIRIPIAGRDELEQSGGLRRAGGLGRRRRSRGQDRDRGLGLLRCTRGPPPHRGRVRRPRGPAAPEPTRTSSQPSTRQGRPGWSPRDRPGDLREAGRSGRALDPGLRDVRAGRTFKGVGSPARRWLPAGTSNSFTTGARLPWARPSYWITSSSHGTMSEACCRLLRAGLACRRLPARRWHGCPSTRVPTVRPARRRTRRRRMRPLVGAGLSDESGVDVAGLNLDRFRRLVQPNWAPGGRAIKISRPETCETERSPGRKARSGNRRRQTVPRAARSSWSRQSRGQRRHPPRPTVAEVAPPAHR